VKPRVALVSVTPIPAALVAMLKFSAASTIIIREKGVIGNPLVSASPAIPAEDFPLGQWIAGPIHGSNCFQPDLFGYHSRPNPLLNYAAKSTADMRITT
jgi:hypothetical protein